MFALCKWGRKRVTACYICYPCWIWWNSNWALWSKRDFSSHPNITNDAIIYKSSLYATSWTFWKNNFDLLWHYIRYITKSTPYKIKILTVVVYFYSFPACYLKIYLHWVFSTFNYLSNIANLKPLSFVVCLQQFVKQINPPSTTSSFKCVFSALQMYKSCHNPIITSWMLVISVHIAKILQVQIFKILFHLSEHIFSK